MRADHFKIIEWAGAQGDLSSRPPKEDAFLPSCPSSSLGTSLSAKLWLRREVGSWRFQDKHVSKLELGHEDRGWGRDFFDFGGTEADRIKANQGE